MCRAKSHPEGGYRCVPPSSQFVKQVPKGFRGYSYRDMSATQGAYWLDPSEDFSESSIRAEIDHFHDLNRGTRHDLVAEEEMIRRIGLMIIRCSDSNVKDLNQEVHNIQAQSVHVNSILRQGNKVQNPQALAQKIDSVHEQSLDLGHKVRQSLIQELKHA